MAAKKFLDIAEAAAIAVRENGQLGGPRPARVAPKLKTGLKMAASKQTSEAELARHLKQKRFEAISAFDNDPQFQEEQYGKNLDWGWVTPDLDKTITASSIRSFQKRGMSLPNELRQRILDQLLAMRSSGGNRPLYQEFVDTINTKKSALMEKYKEMGVTDPSVLKGMERGNARNTQSRDAINAILKTFLPMETAGIPREWTGAVSKALPEEMYPSNPRYVSYVRNVSNVMRNMSNNQRNVFLSQLKDWRGPVDQLAEFVVESVQ